MAATLLAFLVLWILTWLTAKGSCHVSCTTDFEKSLNCSWSGITQPLPRLLEVECRDFETKIKGSCEITSTKGWCLIEPDEFDLLTSYGTNCASRITSTDKLHKTDSVEWPLCEVVKPQHPSNVRVRENDESYNVTWEITPLIHFDQCMYEFKVRIRTKSDPSKDPINYTVVERYVIIYSTTLRQQSHYVVDVQAKLGPECIYQGPWSEWSSTVEIIPEGADSLWWYFFPPVVGVLCFLGLGFFIKPFCLKKVHFVKYIPKPDDFFKPLYQTYDGDFKKWVSPVFLEADHLVMNLSAQMLTERQLEVVGLTCRSVEHMSSEDHQALRKPGSTPLLGPSPQSPSLHVHGEGGQGTGHSGDISIHTVTVSGEEDLLVCRIDGEGGSSMQGGRPPTCPPAMEWPPQVHNIEPEQISLDSFCSNEQSDDGYPRVDLDTFDSGFMESDCSSPMNSDFSAEEQMDSALAGGPGSSNYVKQWMISSTVEGDPDRRPPHSAAL